MLDIFINNLIYKALEIVSLCLISIYFISYLYFRYLYGTKKLGKLIEHMINLVSHEGIEATWNKAKIAVIFLAYSITLILCFALYTIMIVEVRLAICFFEIFFSSALSYYFAFLIVITINWFTSFWPFCKILDHCKNKEIIGVVKSYVYNYIKNVIFLLAIVVVIFLNDVGKIRLLELDNVELYDITIRAIGSSILVAVIIDRFFQHLKTVKTSRKNFIEKSEKEGVIQALNGYRNHLKGKLSDDEFALLNSYIFHLKLAACNREYFEIEEISCYIDKLKYYKKGIDIYLHGIEEFFKNT